MYTPPTLAHSPRTHSERTFDLSILMMIAEERTAIDLLTSTTIRTVGNVVARFWGWGGRIVTGTTPANALRSARLNMVSPRQRWQESQQWKKNFCRFYFILDTKNIIHDFCLILDNFIFILDIFLYFNFFVVNNFFGILLSFYYLCFY